MHVRDRAVLAAVETAAAHGICSHEPAVLADGFNVLVRLPPAPVVARVMTLSSVLGPWGNERISRELAAAELLAAQGVPVSRPTSELPPGPHRCRGLWLSFWEHLEVDAGATPAPEVVGARLRELHRGFRRCPGSATVLDVPTSDIGEFLRMGRNLRVVGSADLEGVERRFATVLPRIGTSRAPHRWLHGDAHPGNLLRANDEWVWTDFEECVFGPVEWDLACLRGSRRVDGAAAVRAYGVENSESVNPGNAGKDRKSGILGHSQGGRWDGAPVGPQVLAGHQGEGGSRPKLGFRPRPGFRVTASAAHLIRHSSAGGGGSGNRPSRADNPGCQALSPCSALASLARMNSRSASRLRYLAVTGSMSS